MKLIEREKEDFWSKPISIELTVEEFAILLSCLCITHPDEVVNMSGKHLGREIQNIDGTLSSKMYNMAEEGTELFKNL